MASRRDPKIHRMPCSFCSLPQQYFDCPACVQAALYPLRLRRLHLLVERESYETQVQYVLGQRGLGDLRSDVTLETKTNLTQAARKYVASSLKAETAAIKERVQSIHSQCEGLRQQMEAMRQQIAEKRSSNENRSVQLKAARDAMHQQKERTLDPLRKAIRKQSVRHDTLYQQIGRARRFLCREAATLAGIRQKSRPSPNDDPLELITIAGVPIADLRRLNDLPMAQLTFSLLNVARLLDLICRYLQVRLPAEIVLPHSDFPYAAMLMPGSSYSERVLPLLNLSSSTHVRDIHSAGHRKTMRNVLRPRILHLDRKLSQLSKDDPTGYSLFVEGACLLAWDLAWLCRSQGLMTADEDWKEIAPIGQNLMALLQVRDETMHRLGQASHGSSHFFLANGTACRAPDSEATAPWRFAVPLKLVDKVRAHLHNEISGLEWEVLDEVEARKSMEDNIEGEPVVVNGRGHTKRTNSKLAIHDGDARADLSSGREDAEPLDPEARGQSGWTKLKSRSGI